MKVIVKIKGKEINNLVGIFPTNTKILSHQKSFLLLFIEGQSSQLESLKEICRKVAHWKGLQVEIYHFTSMKESKIGVHNSGYAIYHNDTIVDDVHVVFILSEVKKIFQKYKIPLK